MLALQQWLRQSFVFSWSWFSGGGKHEVVTADCNRYYKGKTELLERM